MKVCGFTNSLELMRLQCQKSFNMGLRERKLVHYVLPPWPPTNFLGRPFTEATGNALGRQVSTSFKSSVDQTVVDKAMTEMCECGPGVKREVKHVQGQVGLCQCHRQWSQLSQVTEMQL